MSLNKPIINTSNPFKKDGDVSIYKTIYYGEVISIDDELGGGRIKVRINELDLNIPDTELSWSYPLLPKYFFNLPQKGEVVRIFIEDPKYPQKSRFWLGSVVSQLQNIGFDTKYTALSTTNYGLVSPDKSYEIVTEAKGVFPEKNDVAVIGKTNTDLILKTNQVILRAGKHENDNVLKLNLKNPAQILLNFEPKKDSDVFYSNNIIMGDKIALISHDGKPKFKSANLNQDDRIKIFEQGHPIGRGDVIVEVFKVFRNAIINHIHGYSSLPADKDAIIKDLENINLESILQKNIVIN